MNVIIPVAGLGKRLRPHTYSTPKVLLMTGGKPILGHILDKIKDVVTNKIVFIVGHMGDKINEYVSEKYNFPAVYIHQNELLGLGHAIWLTKEVVKDEPCLIIYGDTIFDANLQTDIELDGSIGVKEVRDPSRFGIVELVGKHELVHKFVEKPAKPSSKLAIVGVNFIRNSSLLFNCLDEIISKGKRTQGEFQLTDALQLMVERGAKFNAFQIENWYDCGTPTALLNTNRELLSSLQQASSLRYPGSTIKLPVFIHPSATINDSEVGPYVSIDKDAKIDSSVISDSIINAGAKINGAVIYNSIIGKNAIIEGVHGKLNIGELSSVIAV